MRDLQSRIKLAEITGSVGAGVIGVGLGLFFGSTFFAYWLPILLFSTLRVSEKICRNFAAVIGSVYPSLATV